MIIIINGTIGVGKTWVARTLMCQMQSSVYIEGDNLAFVSDDLLSEKSSQEQRNISRQRLIIDAGLHLIDFYRERGAETFIFDRMFTDPQSLSGFCNRSKDQCKTFRLVASKEVLSKRITDRNRPQHERELRESIEIQTLQFQRSPMDELG